MQGRRQQAAITVTLGPWVEVVESGRVIEDGVVETRRVEVVVAAAMVEVLWQ